MTEFEPIRILWEEIVMTLKDGTKFGVSDVISLLKKHGPCTYQELATHLDINDTTSEFSIGFVCAAGAHGGLICELPDKKYMLVREKSSPATE